MKRFIITITLLITLVGSVFAKPKMVSKDEVAGFEAITWDVGVSQRYTTYSEPLQLFLAEILLDNPHFVGSIKENITDLSKDLQKLIKEYDYYICTLDAKVVAIVYKNDANTVWMLVY